MEPERNRKSPPSLLLVENDKTCLDILCAVLATKYPAVTIHSATDGRAGLASFLAHSQDVVITDIKMPGMGGVQMACEIRAVLPDAKLIVITGDSGRIECQESVGKGFAFDHYIVKPVGFHELFAAIDRCFDAIAEQGDHEAGESNNIVSVMPLPPLQGARDTPIPLLSSPLKGEGCRAEDSR